MSTKQINVLYGIAQLEIGGAERQLYELIRRIDREKYRPLVFTLSQGGHYTDLLQEAGVPVLVCARKNRADLLPVWKISSLIRQHNVQILHTYGYYAGLYARLAAIMARPEVIISTEVGIHAPGTMFGNPVYSTIDRCLSPLTTGYIANAKAVKDHMTKTKGLPEKKVHVVYAGLDLDRFKISSSANSSESFPSADMKSSANRVGILARLDPIKNHHMFLHAIPHIIDVHPDTQFLIIGDGPLRNDLEQLTDGLGLIDTVTFTGTIKGEELIRLVARLDVSVLTSKREGCSTTILETMALGIPNVVTAVGGNPELVIDGQTGFLVQSGDPAALATAVNRLLADDKLRQEMGKAAQKRVVENFSVSRLVRETTAVYENLLA